MGSSTRDLYRWSEPSSYEAERAPAPILGGWTAVVSMEGHWSHCDLWFEGIAAYVGRPFQIKGRIGGIWTVLFSSTIGAVSFPLWTPGAGTRTGIVAIVRGRPCDAFLVEVANAVGATLPSARWRLHCWGKESDSAQIATPSGGPLPVLWTPRHSAGPVGVFVASAVPCVVNCAFVRNDSGGLRWFQIHDLAAAPGAGAAPVLPALPVPDGAPGSISTDALVLSVGCCLVSSLTAAAYTVDAGASLDMGALIQ